MDPLPPLPPPPGELDPRAGVLLRDAAARAGYDDRNFSALGLIGLAGWKAAARLALPRLPSDDCRTLVRFCLLGDSLGTSELAGPLGGPDVLPALARAGLATEESPDHWKFQFVMIPARGVLSVSDPIGDPATENPPDDFVMPVSGSSRFVDDLAVRVPCERVVDIGCGQGYLSLRSLSHAQRCIGTDINARALAIAGVNAALNGAGDRIELREGSFFEPLQDARGGVDLLTCNPPFVIQPGGHAKASVSPMEGDGMLEHLVRTTPQMLRENGWATMIGLWEGAEPADWTSRVQSWLEGSGCDALLLQFRTYRPEEYLQGWFTPEVRAAAEAGWRDLCQRRNIRAITYGGIILRKRLGLNWVRGLFTLINIRSGPASDQLRAYFATQTALQSLASPAAIFDRRLRTAGGWRFDPAQPVGQGAPAGVPPGLALPLPQAAQNEFLVRSFDGTMTARQRLDHLRQWGQIPFDAEHPGAANLVYGLVASGCLDIVD